MHEHREEQPDQREGDAPSGLGAPRCEAEAGAEGRGPDRVAEHRGAEEVATVDVDAEGGGEVALLGDAEEVVEVLGEREADPDRGAVDDSIGGAVELEHAEPASRPSGGQERGDQGEALRQLLDDRRRDHRPEDDVDLLARASSRGRRCRSRRGWPRRSPPEEHREDDRDRLALVEVEEPDQQEDEHGLQEGVGEEEVLRGERVHARHPIPRGSRVPGSPATV